MITPPETRTFTCTLRAPYQQFFTRFLLVFGTLIGVAVGQAALAGSEELDAIALTGPQVYNTACIACHAPPGVGG